MDVHIALFTPLQISVEPENKVLPPKVELSLRQWFGVRGSSTFCRNEIPSWRSSVGRMPVCVCVCVGCTRFFVWGVEGNQCSATTPWVPFAQEPEVQWALSSKKSELLSTGALGGVGWFSQQKVGACCNGGVPLHVIGAKVG